MIKRTPGMLVSLVQRISDFFTDQYSNQILRHHETGLGFFRPDPVLPHVEFFGFKQTTAQLISSVGFAKYTLLSRNF